jgi:hypothetical protein
MVCRLSSFSVGIAHINASVSRIVNPTGGLTTRPTIFTPSLVGIAHVITPAYKDFTRQFSDTKSV